MGNEHLRRERPIGEIFDESVAPKIIGFAYCSDKKRQMILRAVKSEHTRVPDLQALYSGIAFIDKAHWQVESTKVLARLGLHRPALPGGDTTYDYWGVTLDYSHLISKQFPGGF